MKTENAPSQGKNLLIALGTFVATAFLTYGTMSSPGNNLKSTPYQNRNAAADQTLDRLTGAQGRTILDGVVTRVKQKAADKAGNPPNAAAYNAYLDAYLAKVDQLDNTTRASLGRDYEFLFQYIYPRVYESRMNGAVAATAYIDIPITSSSNGIAGAGAGNHKYIPNNLSSAQVIRISDTMGDNAIQLNLSEINFGIYVSSTIQLTQKNGAVINILGADTFQYDI